MTIKYAIEPLINRMFNIQNMGGNALKVFKSERLPKTSYKIIEREVLNRLRDYEFFIPRYPSTKKDFGDLDILLNFPINRAKEVLDILDHSEVVINDATYSIAYQVIGSIPIQHFQVDLHFCEGIDYLPTCFYHSFGDVGNILGEIAKSWGLSFGNAGLSYQICTKFNNASTRFANVKITRDPAEIMNALNLDLGMLDKYFAFPDIGTGGESDVESLELFEWISRSRLFIPEYWSGHLNKDRRVKAKSRPMFREFLFSYLLEKYGVNPCIETSGERVDCVDEMEKRIFIESILQKYGLLDYVNERIDRKINDSMTRKVFNGNLVGRVLGVTGRELGQKINELKTRHPTTLGSSEWLTHPERTIKDLEILITTIESYDSKASDKDVSTSDSLISI